MRTSTHRAPQRRGFTLVELMVVVAMIGILAALGMVGYRKYIHSAQSAEASAVIQGIRASQEAYKAEMLLYLSCSSSLTSYYPMATPGPQKHHWVNEAHGEYALWRQLNVTTDGPVRFGYAVIAGPPGEPMPAATGFASPPIWPSPVVEPWYIVKAAGDRDGDGTMALFISSSLSGEIYSENDSE